MNLIWRFYSDEDHNWRWELLAFDKTVVQASECAYKEYERCLGNAEEHGYHFSPAKSTRPAPGRKLKFARSYAKVRKHGEAEPSLTKREVAEAAVADAETGLE